MMDKALLEMSWMLNTLTVVLILFGHVDAQGSEGGCAPEVRARKTFLRVFRNSPVTISCPVRYCEEIPSVKWFIYDDKDKGIPVNETGQITVTQERSTAHEKEIISYLIFRSISSSDEGLYRCVASVPGFILESHNINISVSDTVLESDNGTFTPLTVSNSGVGWMPYVIICSSILSLVIVVMVIFFLSINGCKCSRKGKSHRTQVPPSPNISGQEMPDQRKNVYNLPAETLQIDEPSVYPARDQENTAQQIVYATLEHLTPREHSAMYHQSREQQSEYASIRIC
ncbi:B- and T-lymphocyte attenuator-like [Salminus brasiliensis]|uniref:B- and T-lymphocyte attenuator-like n=1 Tax=Salminus brasiliensis TaxID=930266 RepID=UPI003B839ED1